MRQNSREGFTLLELLIVIAIIGVLAAMLIPSVLSARARAYDASAQACAKELLTQAEIYHIDFRTYSGFDGSGDYRPNSCGDQVSAFAVTTASDDAVAGTVTSKSTSTFTFNNQTGIGRE